MKVNKLSESDKVSIAITTVRDEALVMRNKTIVLPRIFAIPFFTKTVVVIISSLFLCNCELHLQSSHYSATVQPAEPNGIITSGLGLFWKTLNHRISKWEVYPLWEENGDEETTYSLVVSKVGGPWSSGIYFEDTPVVEYSYFYVEGDENSRFAQISVPLTVVSGESTAEKEVELELEELGLDTFSRHAVFLQGLSVNTGTDQSGEYPSGYNPSHGYTSRGIGAGVKDVQSNSEKITFTTWVRIESGPSDRADMNEAIDYAQIETECYLLVMGYEDGAVTYQEHGYTKSYNTPFLFLLPLHPHAEKELRRFSIAGEQGYEIGFLAIQSFNFKLFGSGDKGDYLRALSVQADLLGYDTKTGTAEVDLDGYASNASTISFEKMENEFSATVALIQLGTGTAHSGHLVKEFKTGTETFALEP